jgi:hypothetical protein
LVCREGSDIRLCCCRRLRLPEWDFGLRCLRLRLPEWDFGLRCLRLRLPRLVLGILSHLALVPLNVRNMMQRRAGDGRVERWCKRPEPNVADLCKALCADAKYLPEHWVVLEKSAVLDLSSNLRNARPGTELA